MDTSMKVQKQPPASAKSSTPMPKSKAASSLPAKINDVLDATHLSRTEYCTRAWKAECETSSSKATDSMAKEAFDKSCKSDWMVYNLFGRGWSEL